MGHDKEKSDPTTISHSESGGDMDAQIASYAPRLRGRNLTIAIAFVSGTGFTLFGYDQGVMSALLTASQFEAVFPEAKTTGENEGNEHFATMQSLLVAIYEIGCLIGALANLWVGDRLGRRKTIAVGGIIMIIGAILQAAANGYAMMIVARIITGLGNGLNTSTVPAYHAECSPAANRGALIMIEGALISFGIMVSYWIDFALFWANDSTVQWRFPIAFQIIFAVIMVVGIFYLPESPRWLVKAGRRMEALSVISALDDKHYNDIQVQTTYRGVVEAVEMEEEAVKGVKEKSLWQNMFTHGRSQNFRRITLGVVVQCFQQITGINLITYYATILFERLGLDDVKSRILAACNGTEYFMASLIAIFIIDRVGRRKLMLFGAVGQSLTMVLLTVLGAVNNSASQIVSAVLLFVFNSFFAIGWLGMTWLYPAEIVGLKMRGPANALSTASNWTFNFLVVMITGPAFAGIDYYTYLIFACINALIVPVVYFFFPETAGRSLEDMDVVFALAHLEGVSPVKVSLRKDVPLAGTPEADVILGITKAPQEKAQHVNSGAEEETTRTT